MRIGIDIGGTNLASGLVNESGQIIKLIKTPTKTKEGYDKVLEQIVEAIKILEEEANNLGESITSVGIGVPGIVKDSLVINAPNIFWKQKDLGKDIKEKTGYFPTLINDATAVAVCENKFGAAQGSESCAFYTLGTGVGGGLIINNRVINGAHGVASEFGHTLSEPNFYTCNCGKNGCLETYASATGIVKRYLYEVEEGTPTNLDQENIKTETIFEGAKSNDPASVKAFEIMTDKLSDNISNLIDILDPEVIVLGGGVAEAGDFLINRIEEKLKNKITYPEVVTPNIKLAQFKNEAGIIGAAFAGDYQ